MANSTPRCGRHFLGAFVVAAAIVAGAGCSGGGGGGGPPPGRPTISVSPSTLNYADPYVGGSYTQTFTIGNTGNAALTVASVAANGTALAHGVSITAPAAPFTVAAAASQTVSVHFDPTDAATLTGAITVVSNDSVTPVSTVTLTSSSSGTPGLSVCAMMGAAVSDGCTLDGGGNPEVDLGAVGYADTVTRVVALSNGGTGNAALRITAIGFDPASPTSYTMSLYTMSGATEVPATLPMYLTPTDPSGQVPKTDLRVRITYTAPASGSGAFSDESVKIDASGVTPASTSVPIIGVLAACSTGKADCDGNPANGCEVPTATDLSNCGACGAVCGSDHAAPTCSAGVCALHCAAGYASCDADSANGCETDVTTLANCGTCGTVCGSANAAPTCTAGACVLNCTPGYASCDGDDSNGCEVNTNTSPDNCSACGHTCTAPAHASPVCTAGTCGWTCNVGWADCDGDPGNGCEQDIGTDPNHCGACATSCSSNHMSTRTCTAGVCSGTCATNYGDCNADKAADGCETDVTSAVANCGTCGNVCGSANATASCVGGICQLTCNPGWGDCDGTTGNGCEVNLMTDPDNCNACNTACSTAGMATRTCTAGVCSGVCAANYGDCDGTKLNGCEVYLPTNSANCGTCGNNCNNPVRANVNSAYCTGSACHVLSCNAGTYDMDGTFSDGCECTADTVSDTCAGATSVGLVAIGGSTTLSRNIVPNSDYDWYEVTFQTTGAGNEHPRIALTDASGILRFTVYDANTCSTMDGCSLEGGFASGRTAWEKTYGVYPYTNPTYTVFRFVVYASASSATCLPYTLTISN